MARNAPKPNSLLLVEVSMLHKGGFSRQKICSPVQYPWHMGGLQGQKMFATSDNQFVCQRV